jgi:hypothetical protein
MKGYQDNPKPSGYAIYRAWFDAEEHGVTKDPMTDFMTIDGDQFKVWTGRWGLSTSFFFMTHPS